MEAGGDVEVSQDDDHDGEACHREKGQEHGDNLVLHEPGADGLVGGHGAEEEQEQQGKGAQGMEEILEEL